MKQINSTIPEGHFVFRNKPNHKGERILYLRYYVNGIPVMSSTRIAVKPSDWNCKKQQVRPKHILAEKYNKMLGLIKDQTDKQVQSYEKPLTQEAIGLMMSGKFISTKPKDDNEVRKDFIQYAIDYNQLNYNLGKLAYSTFNSDNYGIEMFRSYYTTLTGESFLPMGEISMEIFTKYKEYCLMIGNKKQSVLSRKTLKNPHGDSSREGF